MDLALDISNWQGAISPALVQCWAQQGVRRVIVQAVNPPVGYPTGQTREQLQACRDAGMPTDAYVFYWPGQDPAVAVEAMKLADGFDIGTWWADLEATPPAGTDTVGEIRRFIAATGATGIYTRRDWWLTYARNTDEFAGLMLWDAQWDAVPDTNYGYTIYGGWRTRAVKQYGSANLCGATGLDMNVINPEVYMPQATYVGDDYWRKFGPEGNNSLANRTDWPGVAANLEGIINMVQQQTQADDECEAKLTRIQQVLSGGQP